MLFNFLKKLFVKDHQQAPKKGAFEAVGPDSDKEYKEWESPVYKSQIENTKEKVKEDFEKLHRISEEFLSDPSFLFSELQNAVSTEVAFGVDGYSATQVNRALKKAVREYIEHIRLNEYKDKKCQKMIR